MQQPTASIIGTGSSLGSERITNVHLAGRFNVSDEWLTSRTGIKERRRASSKEFTSTLAIRASREALLVADLSPEELDLIICATVTPDYLQMPATACVVQAKLGASKAVAFDLGGACAGFVFGLDVARGFVTSGAYKNILVIGVDLMTRVVDSTDVNTAILFGDGAGAAVVAAREGARGILATHMGSDGTRGNLLLTPAGGSRLPVTEDTVSSGLHFMQMRGSELFKLAISTMLKSCRIVLKRADVLLDDIDHLIPHQANQRITEAVADKLGIAPSKAFSNIEKIGNTGAASIPIALDHCLRSGRSKPGDIFLLTAFGGGISWGSAVVEI
jgi:3-oxoacyl-[acyl-carrier-protein] synthase III